MSYKNPLLWTIKNKNVFWRVFFGLDTKAWCLKGKTAELDFREIKKFSSVNAHVKRMKKQMRAWEKIFANHISNKVLCLEYIRNCQTQVKNQLGKGKWPEQTFQSEDKAAKKANEKILYV
jgi:hypothetical protein